MSMRKLIGGITLATVAAHSAIRFGAIGTHDIHLVNNRTNLFEEADETANYLSVKHHRNIFYDKLSYWRDGRECLEVTMKTCKPMRVTHTMLDGTVIVIQSTLGL